MCISSSLINVIIGPRRAGKSFFAVHALSRLGAFGYANFDDEKLVDTKDYNEIIDAINSLYNKPECILLDEIQNLDKWELFANRLKRQGYNLVITGSNSNLFESQEEINWFGIREKVKFMPLWRWLLNTPEGKK